MLGSDDAFPFPLRSVVFYLHVVRRFHFRFTLVRVATFLLAQDGDGLSTHIYSELGRGDWIIIPGDSGSKRQVGGGSERVRRTPSREHLSCFRAPVSDFLYEAFTTAPFCPTTRSKPPVIRYEKRDPRNNGIPRSRADLINVTSDFLKKSTRIDEVEWKRFQ